MPLNSKWDGRADDYDNLRDCWLNERRLLFVTERIARLDLPDGAAVLEVGSGTGWLMNRLAARFPALSFTGLEPDDTYVAFAGSRASANESYVVGFAEDLASLFESQHFSVILSNDVIHHVNSEPQAFAAAAEIAKPAADWWVIEPNRVNPYTRYKQSHGVGERNFEPSSALIDAERAGWDLVDRRYLFLIPPQVRRAPRWMQDIERRFEGIPAIAGGVSLHLRRTAAAGDRSTS